MDRARAARVFDRMSKATMKELEEWGRIDSYAEMIRNNPELQKPIKRPEVKGFKFEQKFNPQRAAHVQDEISDILNAERWKS